MLRFAQHDSRRVQDDIASQDLLRYMTAEASLTLTEDVLAHHAWRMPDMVVYQHGADEWWLAPLDDVVPIVRINRLGTHLLNAMNGNNTVGTLLNKFGNSICGMHDETGRWCLEHWSLPRYSLCYY